LPSETLPADALLLPQLLLSDLSVIVNWKSEIEND